MTVLASVTLTLQWLLHHLNEFVGSLTNPIRELGQIDFIVPTSIRVTVSELLHPKFHAVYFRHPNTNGEVYND